MVTRGAGTQEMKKVGRSFGSHVGKERERGCEGETKSVVDERTKREAKDRERGSLDARGLSGDTSSLVCTSATSPRFRSHRRRWTLTSRSRDRRAPFPRLLLTSLLVFSFRGKISRTQRVEGIRVREEGRGFRKTEEIQRLPACLTLLLLQTRLGGGSGERVREVIEDKGSLLSAFHSMELSLLLPPPREPSPSISFCHTFSRLATHDSLSPAAHAHTLLV